MLQETKNVSQIVEHKVREVELTGTRRRSGGATHGTRGEDGAFGPREPATRLLIEVGKGAHDARYLQGSL